MPIFDVLLDVLGAVGDIVAAGGNVQRKIQSFRVQNMNS